LGIDKISYRFCLAQIQTSMRERTEGEFSWFCQPSIARTQDDIEERSQKNWGAVATQFHYVFTSK
jgi:hypothetical protein